MNLPQRAPGSAGFTLLPVVLAMSLVAAIAFLLNRDNGVNANLIGAQSDRERARYAAEAGLQAANYAIQAKSCAGGYPIASSPVTDSNFGGATYSAYANNSSGSPLNLTSIGTYNGASVTLTKLAVYAFQSAIQTWPPLQPDFAASKDTAVNPSLPNNNYGGGTEIRLDGGGRELLIQINLPALPQGSRIIVATLMLHRNNTGSPADLLYVMLITGNWSEYVATWNNSSLIYDSRPVSANPYVPVTGWQNLDVTDAAIAWRNGLYPNNGVRIRGGPLIDNARFALGSDPDSTRHPQLIVSYLLPC